MLLALINITLINKQYNSYRSILRVKRSTNLNALYGETGRLPLSVFRKSIIVKYWIKHLKLQYTSLVKQSYLFPKSDAYIGRSYNGTNWASHVNSILETYGFNHIWQEQFNMRIPLELIKHRITDMYLQKWYSEINNSPRLEITVSSNITITMLYIYLVSKNLNIELH